MTSNLKERILQAASELFYRQGIRATGIDAIVKAAGTTKMSLYPISRPNTIWCWRICIKAPG